MEIDFKSIALYLHLKGLSSKEIKEEIDDVFPNNSYTYQQITYAIRSLTFSGPKANVKKKSEKFVYQQRMELIKRTLKDFPFFSLKQIAQKTNIPKTTVHRILTQDLGYISKHLKWIPHILNPSQKVSRINASKQLLHILKEAARNDYRNIITGDESWFYLTTDHEMQWVAPGEKPATREKKMIGTKKFMLTVFWNPQQFFLVKVLPNDMKFNSNYFINEILHPLHKITEPLRKKFQERIILHYDNARSHNSKKVDEYLASNDMDRAPHPPFSPDLAPSDFYLFGYIKNLLAGTSYETPEDLSFSIQQILEGIPEHTLITVFEEWQRRLEYVINSNGDYFP